MNKQTERVFERYQRAPRTVSEGQHIYGDPDSRFTLMLFSDLECPYCKKFHKTPLAVVDESDGLVNLQWRHMPLPFHNPAAEIEAEAAECIAGLGDNRTFWVFLDAVFHETSGAGNGVSDIETIAREVGVDVNAFRNGVNSRQYERSVSMDARHGAELGVQGTPTTFVVDGSNGNSLMLDGSRPKSDFVEAIQSLLNDA